LSLERYLENLKEETQKHNVRLFLKNTRYLLVDGGPAKGYFSEDPPELAIARNNPKRIWLPLLVHEHSHMNQWIEQAPAYTNTWIDGKIDALEIVFSWLKGKEYPLDLVEMAVELNRELELDCERRALKKIRKYNLPIDLQYYTQASGANIHQYNYMLLRRIYPGKPGIMPYEDKEILSKMPRTLRGNFRRLTKPQIEAFDNFVQPH